MKMRRFSKGFGVGRTRLLPVFALLMTVAFYSGARSQTNDSKDIPGVNAPLSYSTISPIFPLERAPGVEGDQWYHFPGSEFHHPRGGLYGADDTYAIDLITTVGSNEGQRVHAIESGIVRQRNNCRGWVLLEHTSEIAGGHIVWKGRRYDRWYSGYLHMKNIPERFFADDEVIVSKGEVIGRISGWGYDEEKEECRNNVYGPHLHFAVYVGNIVSPPYPNNQLESVDPGQIAHYPGLSYGDRIFDHTMDELPNSKDPTYLFQYGSSGDFSDWYWSSIGLYDHMYFTHVSRLEDGEDWGKWMLLTPLPPIMDEYDATIDPCFEDLTLYAFDPPAYANTTNARYEIYKNDEIFIDRRRLNQSDPYYRNGWAQLGTFDSFDEGDTIQVYLDDYTTESDESRVIGFDAVRILAKDDRQMTYSPSSCFEAVPEGHWTGYYYDNHDLKGEPLMIKDEGAADELQFDRGFGTPSGECDIPVDDFAVLWFKDAEFEEDTYPFRIAAEGGYELYIDQQLVSEGVGSGWKQSTEDIPLSKGHHRIVLIYRSHNENAFAYLAWYPEWPYVDMVLILDSSGSMNYNDPQDKRLYAAKAYLTTALPGDYVGVVDFDGDTRFASPLLRLPDNRTSLIRAINTIDSGGGTDIGLGILAGCDALNVSMSSNARRAAIFLTDGLGRYSGEDGCFRDHGWPIYTFGLGDADAELLQEIASNTGGSFEFMDDVANLICEFQRIRAKIMGVEPEPCRTINIGPEETALLSVRVPTGQVQVSFSTSWPGSDVVMTLTTPSGRTIDRTTMSPDVSHDMGPGFEVYSVTNPEPGDWEVSLFGAEVPAWGEEVVFGFTTVANPAQPPRGTDTLTARVFFDYRCNRFYKQGLDIPLGDVPVTLGFPNGATVTQETTPSGMVSFSGFDASEGVSVMVSLPNDYRGRPLGPCYNSPEIVYLEPEDFESFGYHFVQFGADFLE